MSKLDTDQLATLIAALMVNRIPTALEQVQAWIPNASFADVAACIDLCPADIRPRLVALIRDVLTGYPEVLFGIPVLIYYEPAKPADGHAAQHLELPLPDYSPPAESVTTLGWLPLSVLRDDTPLGPRPWPQYIQPYTTECAILSMRVRGADDEPPVPDDAWFAAAFRVPDGDRITITTGTCMPWIDAIEAGCVLLTQALSNRPSHDTLFRRFLPESASFEAMRQGWKFRTEMLSR